MGRLLIGSLQLAQGTLGWNRNTGPSAVFIRKPRNKLLLQSKVEVQGETRGYAGTGRSWMQLMKNEEGDKGEGVSRVIDNLSVRSAAGSSRRKKGGKFTNETIRPVAFGDHGLGDTV